MVYWIANVLIFTSVLMDLYAVYRQVEKTLKCGSSKDVSTAFFGTKVSKDVVGSVAVILYQNWAGLALLIPGLIAYIIAYVIIIRHKPANWEAHGIERLLK